MSEYLDRLKALKMQNTQLGAKSDRSALPKAPKDDSGALLELPEPPFGSYSSTYNSVFLESFVTDQQCSETGGNSAKPTEGALPKLPEGYPAPDGAENAKSAKVPESALLELPKGAVAEFEEKCSVLEFDAGVSREAAERGAAVDLGFASPDAFYTAALASWRAEIERFRPASPPVKKLKEASLEFLAGPLAIQAVRCGWCELSLFGIFDGNAEAARNRLGARGLLPALAWSSLHMKLDSIDREHAVLVTPTGAVLRQRRYQAEIELATEWWRNTALLDGAAQDTTPNEKDFYEGD
jgi:hypothetical protein